MVYFAHLFKIKDYNILLKFQIYKKLGVRTRGPESRVPNTSLHTVFLDYDNIVATVNEKQNEERLIEELRFIHEEFEIGNFYVFETRFDGRHAICVDALTFRDVKDIVDFSSCDIKFKSAPRINEYRCWVLRCDTKGNRPAPKYLYTVESAYEGQNPQSLGHAKYLEKFGLKIDLKNPIGTEEIRVQEYSTAEKHAFCCPSCEKPLQLEFKICPYCGSKLR